MSDLITVRELANALRVPKSWIYSRTRETGPGRMPKIVVGKYRRFILADVMEWLNKKQEMQS